VRKCTSIPCRLAFAEPADYLEENEIPRAWQGWPSGFSIRIASIRIVEGFSDLLHLHAGHTLAAGFFACSEYASITGSMSLSVS
jgi:hypothetical protein